MRTNKISDVTKIVIFAATIVVICVICALGFKLANEGKSAVTSGTSKYNEMAANQDNTEIAVYDGSTIMGNEVANVIKKAVEDDKYLSIYVISNKANVEYNYAYDQTNNVLTGNQATLTVPKLPKDAGYINPDSRYFCTLIRDPDGVIVRMSFEIVK